MKQDSWFFPFWCRVTLSSPGCEWTHNPSFTSHIWNECLEWSFLCFHSHILFYILCWYTKLWFGTVTCLKRETRTTKALDRLGMCGLMLEYLLSKHNTLDPISRNTHKHNKRRWEILTGPHLLMEEIKTFSSTHNMSEFWKTISNE
jgi:hypothetical protein